MEDQPKQDEEGGDTEMRFEKRYRRMGGESKASLAWCRPVRIVRE